MNPITELNRAKREEATILLKEGYTIDQVMKATGMGQSTVYKVRESINAKRRGKKLEYLRIPNKMWEEWDFTINRIGIPKYLRDEWDKLNRMYGKANTYR